MAVSDYTTVDELKIFRQTPSGDTSDDALIALLIPEVSRSIDDYCHRWFYPKTATMVYDFQESYYLMLRDDLQSVTTLNHANGTQTLTSQYYLLYPVMGPPYRWIERDQTYGLPFLWTNTPQQAISIVGVWGYLENGATPNRIGLACRLWLTYLLDELSHQGVRSTTIGDYSITYVTAIEMLKNGPPESVEKVLAYFVKRNFASNVKW